MVFPSFYPFNSIRVAEQEWVSDALLIHMRSRYEDKVKVASEQPERAVPLQNEVITSHRRLHRDVIQAERSAVIRLRDQEQIDDDVLREIERELDLEDQRFRGEEANESLP